MGKRADGLEARLYTLTAHNQRLAGELNQARRQHDEACERLAQAHGQKCCCKKWQATVDDRIGERDALRVQLGAAHEVSDRLSGLLQIERTNAGVAREARDRWRDRALQAEPALERTQIDLDTVTKQNETRKVTQVRQALRIGKLEQALEGVRDQRDKAEAMLRVAQEVNEKQDTEYAELRAGAIRQAEEIGKLQNERGDLGAQLRRAVARDDWPGTLRQIADHLDRGTELLDG